VPSEAKAGEGPVIREITAPLPDPLPNGEREKEK